MAELGKGFCAARGSDERGR